MKVSYFREMRNHHLVVTAGDSLCADYQMKMIRKNAIGGLICPAMRQVDGETEYDYLITGCQSLQTFVETAPVSGAVLAALVNGLCAVLNELERYLLDGEYLAIRPEYIYLERAGEEVVRVKYCIFPFQPQALDEQLRELFKYVINEVDYEDSEAVRVAYDLFQAASGDAVDPMELVRLVGMLNKEAQSASKINAGTNIGKNTEKNAETNTRASTGKNAETNTGGDTGRNIETNAEMDSMTTAAIGLTSKNGIVQSGKSALSEAHLMTMRSEEILWVDDRQSEKVKHRRPADRKRADKCEINLPETGKKSILNMIIRNRR
ncbi:MAG: hypothetical protein IJZ85_13135 [Lachnospiraceae bacterium]|nr:hypothetical protein [Lachnospiraceae bacterium]